MSTPWIPWLANGFLAAFALDASLSLADEVLRATSGATWLLGLRNAVALPVSAWAFWWLPLLAVVASLPTGVLFALSLVVTWLNLGAAPLPLWIDSPGRVGPIMVAIQAAAAVLAFAWVRLRSGRFWYSAESLAGPTFAWRHTFAWTSGFLLLLLPAGFLYSLVALATWTELSTQRFVSFDLSGISLADRTYVRGDRELRLVGMMHLGDGDAYREIVKSFISESTVVLAEGVTDVGAQLTSPPSVEPVARTLGLEAQQDLETYLEEIEQGDEERSAWPVVWRADVDVSDFSPETVAWLDDMGRIWNADGAGAALRAFFARSLETREQWRSVEYDILTRRNEHLLGELSVALEVYERVIVPWGALHLPFIEASILEDGFEVKSATERRLISWLAVAAALSRAGEGDAED